jgi:DNA polymerase bacteriophage-type
VGVPVNLQEILNSPRIICDFETFSFVNVKDVGSWAYAEHPTTEILCLSHGYSGKKKEIWYPGLPFPQYIIDHIEQGLPIEAHNCQFERAVWLHQLSAKFGVPNPKRWIDTLASCAYRGLPLGLDDVGEVLDLPIKKDKIGKQLLQKLSKPRKPTKKNPSTRNTDPELMQQLYAYCITDGEAEDTLGQTLGDLPLPEFAVWIMDQRINHRGVMVDLEAVESALHIVNQISTELNTELYFLTDEKVDSGSQTAKIMAWCRENGLPEMADTQAGTIENYLAQDDEVRKRGGEWLKPATRRVLEIRQQLARASAKKLIKFRDCVNSDGRVRGLLQYHGAGTGRWAGRLVQPQNFPRGALNLGKHLKWSSDQKMAYLIEVIKTRSVELLTLHYGDPMEAIATALRGMFVASPGKKIYVADFAAIEARVVMWLAGQTDALEAFYKYDRGEGPDIYCVTAGKIYKRHIDKDKDPNERQLGKITVLGCGYQMSGGRLQEQARDSYGVDIDLEMANLMVDTFRNDYDRVPLLWRALENAAIKTVQYKRYNEVVTENGVKIGFEFIEDSAGKWLTMVLPSGRRLWYFNPGLQEKEIAYTDKETGEVRHFTKLSLHYEGRNNKKGGNWDTVYTYGGMLTENAVQAIARDLMVAAMYRVEKAGYKIVLSVHDELIAEDHPDRDVKEFEHLVAGPNPAWAEGCPVAAEAWAGVRYRK